LEQGCVQASRGCAEYLADQKQNFCSRIVFAK